MTISQCMPFRWHDGHILILNNSDYWLIGTGSPFSLKDDNYHVSILMQDLETNAFVENLQRQVGEGLLNEISRHIGLPIKALIGSDFLENVDVSIDPLSETILFATPVDQNLPYYTGFKVPIEVPIEILMGIPAIDEILIDIPMIEVSINGQTHKAFLDTGAKLSYISSDLLGGIEAVDRDVEDFFPLLGKFTTDVYPVDISIADNHHVKLKCGILPPLLKNALNAKEIDIIIGSELFLHFAMHLSMSNEFAIFNPVSLEPAGSKERWLQRFKAIPNMYLLNSMLENDFPSALIGDKDVIHQIEERMSWLSPGPTVNYLGHILKIARGEAKTGHQNNQKAV